MVLILTLVLILGVLQSSFSSQLMSEVRSEVYFIAEGVEKSGIEYLDSLENSDKSKRITLISSDGTVLYDNKADPSTMENHSQRDEFIQAKASGLGESKRYSETISEKTVYCAKLLSDGNVIRVASTQYTTFSVFILIAQPLAFVIIAALIISAVLASVVSNKITKPLNDIDFEADEDSNNIYEEIAPLYSKIYSQRRIIEKQLEAAKEQQKEFTAITDAMNEGLVVIDNATSILSYNAASVSLLGYSGDTPTGKSVLVLNRMQEFSYEISDSLSGKHCEKALEINGKILNIIANPVLKNDKIVGAVIFIADITEKADREALRREFSANVSHELKTPLTSISGFAELIRDGMVKNKDVKDCAGRIYDEASRLITLIGDIIRVSSLDEGGESYPKDSQDLKKITDKVLTTLRPVADKRKISINFEGDGVVYGSAEILYEMIYNLCDNAIKYNNDGGRVDINIFSEDNTIKFIVADSGIGIPEKDKERVFERFYRVDKSHSKEIGGTGLGLSIVKHAAIFHGAKISLESEVGKGTKITVAFPEN